MYQFSIVALAYYHKLGGLNNTNLFFYSSLGQRSKMGLIGLKSRCWPGCVPSWRPQRRESVFLPVPVSGVGQHSWLMIPSYVFKASEGRLSPSHIPSFSPLLPPPHLLWLWSLLRFPLSLLKIPVIIRGPHIKLSLFLIPSMPVIPLCPVTYHNYRFKVITTGLRD